MLKLNKGTIGIFGGSFDPVHKGHFHLSNVAIKALKLTQIWWLVSSQNPLKKNIPEKTIMHRLKEIKKKNKNYKVIPMALESHLKTKYSYETIQETTEERARVYRKDFQNIVKEYIKENGLTSSLSDDRLVEKAQKKLFDSIINFDEQDVKHKEELFRLKLLVFESDVAENANRDQKVKIRKASSPLEVLATYYDIIKPKPKRKTRSKKKSEK